MADLSAVIAQVATKLAAVSGIRKAPANPEEQMNVFPFAVVYPGDGESTFGVPGERLSLDSIVIEVHIARKDLPRDVATSLPFADSVPNALMSDMITTQWAGTIDTFESIGWTFTSLGWGGIETLGFRFTVNGIKRRIVF